jgi:hypothetical protein
LPVDTPSPSGFESKSHPTTSPSLQVWHRRLSFCWLTYGWRLKINAMLGKRMSLEEIAARLNAQRVPPIHGTNCWTASSVRKAFVS